MLIRFTDHPVFSGLVCVDVYHQGCSVLEDAQAETYEVKDPSLQEWILEIGRQVEDLATRGRGRAGAKSVAKRIDVLARSCRDECRLLAAGGSL